MVSRFTHDLTIAAIVAKIYICQINAHRHYCSNHAVGKILASMGRRSSSLCTGNYGMDGNTNTVMKALHNYDNTTKSWGCV